MRTYGSYNRIFSLICKNEECETKFGARTTQPKLCPECKAKDRIRQQKEYYKRRKEKQECEKDI